jgi:hypothetical protein
VHRLRPAGSTDFFRDPDLYEYLRNVVVPDLVNVGREHGNARLERDPQQRRRDVVPFRDENPTEIVTFVNYALIAANVAAWFLLHDDAERWLACTYAECQHHWAVEAEEDAYELEEVLELAGRGAPNPVDAAYQRRRLLTLAFGDISDVPLAGAGDLDDFLAFYTDWVARGRSEEEFEAAARELRGDADT